MIVLAGDVGGTNARLGLFRVEGERPEPLWRGTWPSRAHASLAEILGLARPLLPVTPEAVAIGIAGPVVDGVCRATNLPWVVEARPVAEALGLASARLLNDLEASAWGLAALRDADLHTLLAGAPGAAGNRALVSAGTGLGEAGLAFDGRRWHPFPSEGGHCDFAPADELQDALLRWLRVSHPHVSWERVLSGPGLASLHAFLRSMGAAPDEPPLTDADPAPSITKAALAGTSPLAVATLDLFASLYGAEAANTALKLMATGGVYLGGGIAPRIVPFLEKPRFRDAFLSKGRLRPLLERIPVRVVLEPDTALLGAARCAAAG